MHHKQIHALHVEWVLITKSKLSVANKYKCAAFVREKTRQNNTYSAAEFLNIEQLRDGSSSLNCSVFKNSVLQCRYGSVLFFP